MTSKTFIKLITGSCSPYLRKAFTSNTRNFKYAGCRTLASVSPAQSKNDKETFQDVLPSIINNLVQNPRLAKVPEAAPWITRMIEYNLTGGKKNRGLSTVIAYEMLEKPENVTDENLRLARIMGWCVEMLQAYFIVADDMMDGSETRRGRLCWYKQPDVGLNAINDAIFLISSLYTTLQTFFEDKPYYVDVLHCFNETVTCTSMGQHLDVNMVKRVGNKDYSAFTMTQYDTIVKLKTSYYTFRLPVFLGLMMANKQNPETMQQIEEVCLDMGRYFQMQDDFIDCFSNEKQSGKVGTDIREGKCSWLAVSALERCSAAQRSVFTACYGSAEPAHVQRVKRLYGELRLPELYADEERRFYDKLTAVVASWPDSMAPSLFMRLLGLIYKRTG